ncbi:universal stress protein [Aquimarina gracilis]|uniref:Universal stress protein n=1 Tax=Aquimarina gracilis TaxID=874422 RepID=A0ABU6A1B3_9FLAO|nr:universal stress protein [Aquimarina gracilis]MEB3347886.1 universal stress protein [Aquimarina gracilis]
MKNILVPLGLSENSITLNRVEYAINLAKELGGTVYVTQVFKELPRSGSLPTVNKTLKQITASSIEEQLSELDKKGVEVVALPLEGELLEAIPKFNLENAINLIVLGPENGGIKDPYFLGETSGSLVKKTEIPILIVPENYRFAPINKVLMAIKSGSIKKKNALAPIKEILTTFGAQMKLLQVKTTDFLPGDSEIQKDLETIISSYKSSENATLFQGVLEHLNANHPDLLCVFRRKRGFFAKLWEENTILKRDFESRIPLLILRGSD